MMSDSGFRIIEFACIKKKKIKINKVRVQKMFPYVIHRLRKEKGAVLHIL